MSAALDKATLRLRLAGAMTLAVDSSSARAWQLTGLCTSVARVNETRGVAHQLQVVLPALVHAERLFQLRRTKGANFSQSGLRELFQPLRHQGLQILAFDEEDAERHAEVLSQHYPSDEDWEEAKKRLGNKRSTVDWFISSQTVGRKLLLITEDSGEDQSWVAERATRKQVLEVLGEMLGEAGGT